MNWYKTFQKRESIDDFYMKAIKSQDLVTVKRLIDKAANTAGYTLETEHQTIEIFTEFSAGEFGFHMGKLPPGMLGKTMSLRIRLKNPLRLHDLGVWEPDEVLGFLWQKDVIDDEELSNARSELEYGRTQVFSDRLTDENAKKDLIDYKKAYYELSSIVRELIKSKGYDGIIYNNKAEGYEESYIVFDSNQIKSGDLITYDNKGDIIPISLRFDFTNSDIRW